MQVCTCDTHVPDDRRTCPGCGKVINPTATDPGIQDQTRSTTTIARLRSEVDVLEKSAAAADLARVAAETETSALRDDLAQIAGELREVLDEIRELKSRIQAVEERSRQLRARFEAHGISIYRPFDASQVQLFPTEFGEPPPAQKEDSPE